MKKSVFVLSLIAATSIGVCSCGKQDERKSRSKSFTFSYFRSGYGDTWVKNVTDYYMNNVDTDVYIDLKQSVNSESARTEIIAGQKGMKDIYQLEVDMSGGEAYLEDLTSIYNSSLSEYGEDVTVKSKIEKRWLDFYNEKDEDGNDRWFRMPQTTTNGWNWIYNKTTIDTALGEGSWELPRTTNEFFELGEQLKQNETFLACFAGGGEIAGEYTRYGNEVWFAQMLGTEGYQDYVKGYYYEGGIKKFASDSPKQILNNRSAIESAYNTVYKFFDPNNHYMHSSSDTFSYTNVDQVIYNGKVNGSKKSPAAFAYLGAWLETEIQDSVDYGFIDPTTQELYAMKTPVISDIISRTPSIRDDDTLSQVVAYVDGDLANKPQGVTDEDVAIIKDARSIVAELICREFVIPKNASNKDEAKKFLTWLTTVDAQKIASKGAEGTNVLPYGYVPTDEDMGFTISPLKKSIAKIKETSYILDESGLETPYKSWFGLGWIKDSTIVGPNIFGGTRKAIGESYDPVQEIYDYVYGSDGSKYESLMRSFLIKYPEYNVN